MRFLNIFIFTVAEIVFWFPLIATASPNSYNLTPVYMGAVGNYEPLAYYPVAVAYAPNGIYSVDLHYKEVQLLDASGLVAARFSYQDQWPRDIEVDVDGNIFLASAATDNKIRKYDMAGNLLAEIGYTGSAPGGFEKLRAIVLDENTGDIYAADKGTQLSVFDSAGNLLWNNMATVSSSGNLPAPQGIDRDTAGNIYVADSTRNQIVIFDPDGNYLREIGPTGNGWRIKAPVGVAVGSDGAIYVLNRLQLSSEIGEDQVLKFSNSGTFISSWGAKGRAPGELWEQQGIDFAADGTIWVAGYQGHNIVHYDAQGNLIEEWNDHSNIQPGKFAQVRGAVIGKDARLYVTDFWNQLVQVFDRYGKFLFKWGERGQGDGQYFNFPRFTAVNDADQIYVSDDREVRVFEEDGTFVGRSDWITFPGGIEVDNAGSVWVTGMGENTVRSYTSTLNLIQVFDGSLVPNGFNNPYGIVQGLNGNLYVADTFNHRIVRMATDGSFQMEFGTFGNGLGQFRAPVGLAADSEGHIFTSETWNKRIQVFSPDGNYLAGWDVPGQADKDVARVYELTMDGDYFLYAPDHTRGQAEVHKYALVPPVITSGQPNYIPGQDLGFNIWSDDGAIWHIRWSSDGVLHDFSGTITSTVPFVNIIPVGLEAGDQVQSMSASRLDFNANDANGQDGIDIAVTEAGVITFDLSVDGIEQSSLVTVGVAGFTPSTLPIPLSTQSGGLQNIDAVGQPDYVPAQDAGYFLWQDSDDGEWHLRWSGDSVTTYQYEGTISSTSLITNVREYSYEGNDSLTIVSASEFNFNAAAGAGEDGIDFYVSEGEKVSFSLSANGNTDVAFVYIGSSGANPSTMPFTLLSVTATNPPVDTEVPAISIIEPADGGIVAGDVQVLADAFDNIDVDKVTFAIDGAWVARDDTAPYSYTWPSSTHANGSAQVQATAFDLAGNKTTATIFAIVDNLDTDTEAPTISIIEPADDAIITGSVQVLADAFDNIDVDKVTFAIDGAWVARDNTAPYSFTWHSSTHANGTAKVQATAFDLAGNKTTATIFATVDNLDTDTEAPTISIIEPADDAIVTGSVQVLADAFDNIDVDKVTFAVDGVWVGRDDAAPYSYAWHSSTHANGPVKVQATAFDLAGNTTTATIFATVSN